MKAHLTTVGYIKELAQTMGIEDGTDIKINSDGKIKVDAGGGTVQFT